MVQLIKKGGLRERANRSQRYQGSENTETTLQPNGYTPDKKNITTTLEPVPLLDPSKPDENIVTTP